ncbi:excisionase family DNA-binding protein [Duganella sp. FT94W]|uniref:Excisionase family DNA-binding protein n=1 Tax=Duganella lactea TaxID=2692173 RepID=A0ABW9VAQ2_9BURK|nr:GAF domain-containing protein [Duganella lactea]MYM35754.1 excisionase family DNA-binding protein [Duganella lactea]
MNSSIITTAQAAKILGVSPRTAQLWTESGVIPSWKTPGGHRRMFEADVLAILHHGEQLVVAPRRVLVLAPVGRHASWSQALATLEVAQVTLVEEPVAAAVALGATVPDVLIVEADNLHALPENFLTTLRHIALLSRLQIIIANPPGGDSGTAALAAPGPFQVIQLAPSSDQLAAQLASLTRLKPLRPLPLPAELRNAPFPILPNEAARLLAVHRSGLLDSASEEALDSLTRIAALSLAAPVALITVLSEDRQWFKANSGLDMTEAPRSWAFCNYTVLQSGIQQFPDLAADPRFADNPAVRDAPHFRFYAGAPVTDDHGYPLGSLCVIDTRPRELDATQTEILSRLARLATAEINRRTPRRNAK